MMHVSDSDVFGCFAILVGCCVLVGMALYPIVRWLWSVIKPIIHSATG